jgi:hypothetical protein
VGDGLNCISLMKDTNLHVAFAGCFIETQAFVGLVTNELHA